jgi:hypothetical protein
LDRVEQIAEFNKVWDIKLKPSKNFKAFRNRILTALDTIVGDFVRTNKDITRAYLYQIGEQTSIKSKSNVKPVPTYRSRYRTCTSFADHPLYITISSAKNEKELTSYLQKFLWALQDTNWEWAHQDNLLKEFKIAIALSDGIKIQLSDQSGSAVLYPNISPLLAKELVDQTLQWLAPYQSVCQKYQRAINLLQKNDASAYRDIIDNSRLALEILLREVLENKQRLEDQGDSLGKFLKESNTHPEIRTMFHQNIGHFAKYNNDCVKHQSDKDYLPSLSEVELMVHQAGAIMRFLLQKKNERKRKEILDKQSGI